MTNNSVVLTKELFVEENTRVFKKELTNIKFFKIRATDEVQINTHGDTDGDKVKRVSDVINTISDKAEMKLYQLVWKNPTKEDEKYCTVVLSILDIEKDREITYETLYGGKLSDSPFDKFLSVLQDLPNDNGCLYVQKLTKTNGSDCSSTEIGCITCSGHHDHDLVSSIVDSNKTFVATVNELNGYFDREIILECDPVKVKAHLQHIYDECSNNEPLYANNGKVIKDTFMCSSYDMGHLLTMLNLTDVKLVSVPSEVINGLKDELIKEIDEVIAERELEKEDILRQSEEYRRFGCFNSVTPDVGSRFIQAVSIISDSFVKYREWYNSLDACKSNILQLGILSGYIKSGYGDILINSLNNQINRMLYGFNISNYNREVYPLIGNSFVNFDVNNPLNMKDFFKNVLSSDHAATTVFLTVNGVPNVHRYRRNRLATEMMGYLNDDEGSEHLAVTEFSMTECLSTALTVYICSKLVIDHDKLDKSVNTLKSMFKEYHESLVKKHETLLAKFSDPTQIDDITLLQFKNVKNQLDSYNAVLEAIDKNVEFIKTSGLKTIRDMQSYNLHQSDDNNDAYRALNFIKIASRILRDGSKEIDGIYCLVTSPLVCNVAVRIG